MRNLNPFANQRRDTTSALARLRPELLCDCFGEFDCDTLHGAHIDTVTHT